MRQLVRQRVFEQFGLVQAQPGFRQGNPRAHEAGGHGRFQPAPASQLRRSLQAHLASQASQGFVCGLRRLVGAVIEAPRAAPGEQQTQSADRDADEPDGDHDDVEPGRRR